MSSAASAAREAGKKAAAAAMSAASKASTGNPALYCLEEQHTTDNQEEGIVKDQVGCSKTVCCGTFHDIINISFPQTFSRTILLLRLQQS